MTTEETVSLVRVVVGAGLGAWRPTWGFSGCMHSNGLYRSRYFELGLCMSFNFDRNFDFWVKRSPN